MCWMLFVWNVSISCPDFCFIIKVMKPVFIMSNNLLGSKALGLFRRKSAFALSIKLCAHILLTYC